MARRTRSSGVVSDDTSSIRDWEELAAASAVSELRRLVSRYSIRVRPGAALVTVQRQLARVFPVVSLSLFRSAATRAFVSATLESIWAATHVVHSTVGSIAVRGGTKRPAQHTTGHARVHLVSHASSAQLPRPRRPLHSSSGMAPAQTPCAARPPGVAAAAVAARLASADAQAQMSSPPLHLGSQSVLAGQPVLASNVGPLATGAAAVPESRALDAQTPDATPELLSESSQPQLQRLQLIAPALQGDSPVGQSMGSPIGPTDGTAIAFPRAAPLDALMSQMHATLSNLQQHRACLLQQEVEVASQIASLTRCVQQMQSESQTSPPAAGPAEPDAAAPAARRASPSSPLASTPVEPAAAPAAASTERHQSPGLVHAPSRKAGRDLVFVGLPLPPVIAGRSYMPAHRAVLRFCSSQLRIDLRPQDLSVRSMYGRSGARTTVVVRVHSMYVVNSIITAKSVLLDGRCPISVEFSQSSAVRHERGGVRQHCRSQRGRQQHAGGTPPPAAANAAQVSSSVQTAAIATPSSQHSPVARPACHPETAAAAPQPDR